MNWKPRTALVLALVIGLAVIPLHTTWDPGGPSLAFSPRPALADPVHNGYVYQLIEDDTEVQIIDYTGADVSLDIPGVIDGRPVTRIATQAFQGKNLTSVTIPVSVTGIGERAFQGNSLAAVDLPANLTALETRAFFDNNLTSVTIPAGITTIADLAFGNNNLTSLDLPSGLTTIGDGAFDNNSLTSVDLPDALITIGDEAFDSNSLTSLVIPANVTSIGNDAFYNNSLTSLDLPDALITIGNGAFAWNSLTSLDLPTNVTSIGNDAFHGNSLATLSLNDGLTTIGARAFQGNNLVNIVIPDTVTEIGARAFASNDLVSATLSQDLTAIPNFLFGWNSNLTNVNIPGSVTSIGQQAFHQHNITSIVIPEGVETIGLGAFGYGPATSLSLPSTLTGMGGSVFRDNDLVSVTIPEGVETIGQAAFTNNPLTNVVLPESVTDIRRWAFENAQLSSIILPGAVQDIGQNAFRNCPLTLVYIGETVDIHVDGGSMGNHGGAFRTFYQGNGRTAGRYDYAGAWSFTPVAVTGVSVSPGAFTVGVGQTHSLTADVFVSPSYATDRSLTWSTGDASVATVDASGTVTGEAPGTTQITVQTQDGGFTTTADITVPVPDSSLSGLALSHGALSPAFSPATTAYQVSVGHAVDQGTITPTAADPGATITVDGLAVPSGQASPDIGLSVGPNTIDVVVTAALGGGAYQTTYEITVTRAGRPSRPAPPEPEPDPADHPAIAGIQTGVAIEGVVERDGTTFSIPPDASGPLSDAIEAGETSFEIDLVGHLEEYPGEEPADTLELSIDPGVLDGIEDTLLRVITPWCEWELPPQPATGPGSDPDLTFLWGAADPERIQEQLETTDPWDVIRATGTPVFLETPFDGTTRILLPLPASALPEDPGDYPAFLERLRALSIDPDGSGEFLSGEVLYEEDARTPAALAVEIDGSATLSLVVLSDETLWPEMGLTIGDAEARFPDDIHPLDSPPAIPPGSGRTMIPVRFIAESLGAQVEWLPEERAVRVFRDHPEDPVEIHIPIGSSQGQINGQDADLGAAATIDAASGRTLVSLRPVPESLGARVDWDPETRSITIRAPRLWMPH